MSNYFLNMRKLYFIILSGILCLISFNAEAQLSKNPNKFLGNITTRYSVDAGGGVPSYYTLWNQITPENESKWGSVEGTQGRYNWGSDTPFNYAKNHNFTYKFHALIWGAQYPSWFSSSMSVNDRYNAIVKWFDAVKAHYPDLPMIDVVNEAVGMHQQGNPLMKESLGGGGKTGYDWLIKAFEMAHERWPNAILIYNDYNTFQHDTDAYIDLVRTLRDAGAPIDAYGCQSHDVDNISKSNLQSAMNKIQNALKMPMYITELDVNVEDDDQQKAQYESIFPLMWEADYCAGVTIWGYVYGATWVDHSGLYKDGVERPAMTWLKEYMASDAATNAKSPFPGMKKEASVYVKPASIIVNKGEQVPITVRASMRTKTIDYIELYVNDELIATMTDAPYETEYLPETTGKYNLKAVVYTDDGDTYERLSGFTAYNPRKPHKTINLPGTIQAEDFDEGAPGISYYDSDNTAEGNGSSYRSDGTGVDIVTGNSGYAIGYTSSGEWLEYTVNVKEAGVYTYTAYVSSGTTGSSFSLSLNDNDNLTDLTGTISVPQTGSNDWGTYTTVTGRLKATLDEGTQVIRLNITGSSCNIDKIVLNRIDYNENIKLSVSSEPVVVNGSTTIKVDVNDDEVSIANVKLYQGTTLLRVFTQAPYEYVFKPTKIGNYTFLVVATDVDGGQSDIITYSLKVSEPFSGTPIEIPGTIQIEDFDKGGEGVAFHDSDSDDEGDANYRTDNGGVDLKARNGGIVIGNTADGEWLEYTVNVLSAGNYKYSVVASSGVSNSGFRIGVVDNGVNNICNVNIPQTGDNSWSNYQTVTGDLGYLDAGLQILRVTIDGAYCNIDRIELTLVSDDVNYILPDDRSANGTRYNLGGSIVGDDYKGIIIINGKKILNNQLK